MTKWFTAAREPRTEEVRRLADRYRAGGLSVTVSSRLFLEVLNVAEPMLEDIARWIGVGLTAYDACYVALAETRRTALITDDALILSVAEGTAVPLATM